MRKRFCAILGICAMLVGCGSPAGETSLEVPENIPDTAEQEQVAQQEYEMITIDENTKYQTIESFGTSGCWWSQYVGGFDKDPDEDGVSTRDAIATLLFDREKGIGLSCYRFNLGAGSVEAKNGDFSDIHRRAQNFLDENGNYDFSKDENAVWFLKKATEMGVGEVVLFCNSPLVTLTENGMAHMTEGGSRTNLDPSNYPAFANTALMWQSILLRKEFL